MSTSIILLEQDFNANDVDIMVFESSDLFLPRRSLGDDMVRKEFRRKDLASM